MPQQTFSPATHTTPYLAGGTFASPTLAYDGNSATAATTSIGGTDHDILFLSTGITKLRGNHSVWASVTFDIGVAVTSGSPAGTWYIKCINNGQTLLSGSAPYTRAVSHVKIFPYVRDLAGSPFSVQFYNPNFTGGSAIMSIYEVTFTGTTAARVQVIG